MYGLVNKAIEDYVCSNFDADTWERAPLRHLVHQNNRCAAFRGQPATDHPSEPRL